MIYLDAAATAQPDPRIIYAMMPYLKDMWFNPSALYKPATIVKKAIHESQQKIANLINSKDDEIFFTSGGSESNCWAIQGFINYWNSKGEKPVVITSVIEHKSIIECVENIASCFHFIDVDSDGFININKLEAILQSVSESKILVSIQFANNEIGTIQKIDDISDLVHKYGGIFHTDAVQAFGHINIDVKKMRIDMLSASGHKIGTPKGIGILYKKNDVHIKPIIYGTQMNNMRGGTENVPYIVGFGKAAEIQYQTLDLNNLSILRDYFIEQLIKKFDCKINGSRSISQRLPNNINITFKQNLTGEALIYLLDMCDIYISSGSACNSHSSVPSHVLQAIGLSDEDVMKTIRITIPKNISKNEIDNVICEMESQIKLLTS